MPTPIGLILRSELKSGEVVFKRGRRRVSKSAFNSQQWRMRGGKAGTIARRKHARDIETAMRADLGAPPAGHQWNVIAGKYSERFEDYLESYGISI